MTLKTAVRIAVVGFAALGLLAGTACQAKSDEKSIVTKRIDDTLEKASGGKVDLDLKSGTLKVQTPEGEKILSAPERTWPEDLPEGVVKFEEGAVVVVNRSSNQNGKVWTIHFMNVGEGALEKYADKLKAGGWTVLAVTPDGAVGGTLQATKGELQMSVVIEGTLRSGFVSVVQMPGK